MVLFNGAGFLIVVVTGLLSWGVCSVLSGGALLFGLTWIGLAGASAVFYDRLDPEEGFSAYWRWFNLAAGHRSRIAGLGVPLLFMPPVVMASAYIFPKIDGDKLPPAEFFLGAGIISVAVLVGGIVAQRLRQARPPDVGGDPGGERPGGPQG